MQQIIKLYINANLSWQLIHAVQLCIDAVRVGHIIDSNPKSFLNCLISFIGNFYCNVSLNLYLLGFFYLKSKINGKPNDHNLTINMSRKK